MAVIARSASDKTDDWPFWMLWDGHMNVTGRIAREIGLDWPVGAVFTTRREAEWMSQQLADAAAAPDSGQ